MMLSLDIMFSLAAFTIVNLSSTMYLKFYLSPITIYLALSKFMTEDIIEFSNKKTLTVVKLSRLLRKGEYAIPLFFVYRLIF